MCAMKEQIFKLESQLSQPGEGTQNHFHYHDNRCIIIQGNVPMDLSRLEQPIPLMWYNRHNDGAKHTRVFLGKQAPKKHPETGEFMLDLLSSADATAPSILGIFPRHLSVPYPKRQRRR